MESADLETVVRACWKEIIEGRATPAGGVGLDLRHLPLKQLESDATIPFQRIREAGLDPEADIIEVSPVAHYQIGGVVIDENGATSVPGLFAAGEDAGGVHGAAWTGGNGMAEALVLGTSAGQAAAKTADTKGRRPTSPIAVATRPVAMKPTTPSELVVATRNLRSLMWHFAGPVRTAEGLEEARNRLTEMAASVAPLEAWSGGVPSPELLDLRNLLVSSLFLVESALARPGSLGVHWRDDAPTPVDDPDLAYSTVEITQGEVLVEMRPVDFEYVHPPPLN